MLSSVHFWSVIPRCSWVYPGPSSVHAFTVFICGVLFGFLHFGVLVAPAMTGSGNKALLPPTNSRRVKIRAYLPKAANTMLDIAVMCQVIAGTSYTQVSLIARAISCSAYAPPAEGGFLYLTHHKWESLKEGHMRFLSPAFVFIHSEEVFIFV